MGCILIVDDDEDILVMMQNLLESEGYEPLISPYATNVMEIISQRKPDMIFLDLQMGELHGEAICQAIKADPTMNNIPLVLFSSNDNIVSICKECGADGYLPKPFVFDSFRRILGQFVH